MSDRTATISRKTNETEIEVYVNLDCQPGSASPQVINVSTGIGFLDHVRSPPKRCIHSQDVIKHDLMHVIDVQCPCQA
jgi:imidazoleglycerol phosphate dehydratase HisB